MCRARCRRRSRKPPRTPRAWRQCPRLARGSGPACKQPCGSFPRPRFITLQSRIREAGGDSSTGTEVPWHPRRISVKRVDQRVGRIGGEVVWPCESRNRSDRFVRSWFLLGSCRTDPDRSARRTRSLHRAGARDAGPEELRSVCRRAGGRLRPVGSRPAAVGAGPVRRGRRAGPEAPAGGRIGTDGIASPGPIRRPRRGPNGSRYRFRIRSGGDGWDRPRDRDLAEARRWPGPAGPIEAVGPSRMPECRPCSGWMRSPLWRRSRRDLGMPPSPSEWYNHRGRAESHQVRRP